MITLLAEKNKKIVKEIFDEKKVQFDEYSGVLTARFGDEILGMCLYSLTKEKMTILHIEPTDDIMLLDGILRSTIHIATENFVVDVYYSDNIDAKIFKKIGFIKDETNKTLDADKLFRGCGCHENANK